MRTPRRSRAARSDSDLVDFDFAEVKVANNLFKQVVREAKYDVAELAIVTYLQAKAYGKPYVLVPAVVVSRGQHHTIAYNPERGPLKPSELNGKRVGVRAYTVTTGTWVRGILASDYGVDIDKVEWITFEDPHVAEYHDPAIVKRAPARQGFDADAARRRRRRRHRRRQATRSEAQASHSRRRRGCAKMGRASPRRPDQSHGGGQARAVALAARRRQRHFPPVARQQDWPPDCPTAARSIPTGSASRPAGRYWKSSSTSATSRSSSRAACRSTNCSTIRHARWR